MDGVGSMYALHARGPQDTVLLDPTKNAYDPTFKQYTDFSIETTKYTFGSAPYLGTTQTLSIPMKGFPGDLLSNMFLKCTIPQGYTYIENTGRALIQSISLYLDTTEVETLDDDWAIIRDQLFLDADEREILQSIITGPGALYIPLDFFFCRRRGTQAPYFPVCGCYKQTMYVNITFATSELLTGTSGCDISDVSVVIEHVTLTDLERIQFMQPKTIIVDRVFKEPINTLTNGVASINLTASFKVKMMAWFIRYTLYETSVPLYTKRYSYGYIPKNNFALQNNDPFDYLTLYIDNKEVTDRLSGVNFFSLLQPLMHGYSTPDKDIYMYSFGLDRHSGFYDMATVDSKCTLLNIKINPNLVNEITKFYSIHVYHYGYSEFEFRDGTCSRLYS